MRRLAVAVGALLFYVPAAVTISRARAEPAAFWPAPVLSPERLLTVSVRVDSRGGGSFDTGTGVGIGPHVVLTNAHLTRGMVTLVTRCDDDVLAVERIARAVDGVDLAAVVTAGPELAPVELAPQDPVAGQHVTLVGFPGGARTITDARVEGTLERDGKVALRFSPEPHPGQSGGPLVDDFGRLVGLAYAEDVVGGQGLAFPVSRLRAAIDQWQASGVPLDSPVATSSGVLARTAICG